MRGGESRRGITSGHVGGVHIQVIPGEADKTRDAGGTTGGEYAHQLCLIAGEMGAEGWLFRLGAAQFIFFGKRQLRDMLQGTGFTGVVNTGLHQFFLVERGIFE